MYEYEARMHAYKLERIDKERDMHMQAWLNQQVKATKEKGKKQVPIFKNFKEFYDYEKNISDIENHMSKTEDISDKLKRRAQIAKKVNGG